MSLVTSEYIGNKNPKTLERTAGDHLQYVLFCVLKHKYVSSIKKGRRYFTGDLLKAKKFKSKESAEKKMQYFQKVKVISAKEI